MSHPRTPPRNEQKAPDFPVPAATATLLRTVRHETRDDKGRLKEWRYELSSAQDNLLLAFQRFVPKDPGKPYEGHGNQYLSALAQRWNREGRWSSAAEAAAARAAALLESLKSDGWSTATHELQTEWRLIVGLGYQNALEVGMTLHPLYGFPYIPGTAVKGVARAWTEIDGGDPALIRRVFGSETKQDDADNQLGAVRFFDALPTTFPKLAVDIMNPHYPRYYGENEPPGDWQDPVPIPFLTVAPGNRFRFLLVSREAELRETAWNWLKSGLMELGTGGKTSAGYGYFAPAVPSPTGTPARNPRPAAEQEQPLTDADRLAAWTGKSSNPTRRRR